MSNDKTREDLLAEEALDELLSLSGKSRKPKKVSELLKERDEMVQERMGKVRSKSVARPTGLAAIVQNAKKNEEKVNKDMWDDPERITEMQLAKKIKDKKKSAYDSDVLRERILRRQAEKRGMMDSPMEGILANYKKNINNDNEG
jgi:hypothetical protein